MLTRIGTITLALLIAAGVTLTGAAPAQAQLLGDDPLGALIGGGGGPLSLLNDLTGGLGGK
ncbi:hypothetical protein [Nonomuraea dietziae]|uniref:hypothetical protein n=1 Tax=Nonomuraea dietziae TaxID=65515 RepID=UPI00343AEE55